MRLFEEKENKVSVASELKLIPEFKQVLEKEKASSIGVFGYIYFMCDYRSPYSNYAEEERHSRLVKDLNLGAGWKIAPHVKKAMDRYVELQDTPAIKTLKAIREGLVASSNAIDMLSRKINEAVDGTAEDSDTEDVIKLITSLLGIADKLPKAVDSISALEEKIKKEQSNDTRVRGGGSIGYFED